jgi:hypothetical protein
MSSSIAMSKCLLPPKTTDNPAFFTQPLYIQVHNLTKELMLRIEPIKVKEGFSFDKVTIKD